ncbi:DNA alkylation repair protein [Candidatus Woesearchaeota archaeon]|nr:DNA alkylation repair protein [Candidatus Woesearchaeota archaeon]
MKHDEILKTLKSRSNPENVKGMARFGINQKNTLGVSIPILRDTAKKIGKNHELALQLWDSEIHEARILSSMIDEPKKVTKKQMDSWADDFDSWDTCDQVCMNLFWQTESARKKVFEWSKRKEEFVKRAAFALIAVIAFKDKKADDKDIEKFLPLITNASTDERNFVKKAVNWALRQIGKKNKMLNKKSIATAKKIEKLDSKAAKWIAKNALRELQSAAVKKRLTSQA